MKKRIIVGLISSIMLSFASTAYADKCVECDYVKKVFEGYGLSADSVKKIDEMELFEIISQGNVYYTDMNAEYLLYGHLIDPKRKLDLTKVSLDNLARTKLKSLPFKNAIVSGDLKSKNGIIVFTDPDCPYCKRLEPALQQLKGVKVYTFLFPLMQLHPRAKAHSEAIWCSEDREAAMTAVMINNQDLSPPAGCTSPVMDNLRLGQQLGVTGTPTIFRLDGARWSGAPNASQLEAWVKKGS